MDNVWTALLPLILGSALVPVQLLITILLIANSRRTALAWVAGATTVRLAQGALFGLVLGADDISAGAGGPGPIASTLLLVVAVLFLATALKHLIGDHDPDAPPPAWMAAIDGWSAGRSFLYGAGAMTVGVKFWVFTLSAIAVIADADLGRPAATITFGVFVVLASSAQLALIGVAFAIPDRADVVLGRASAWLTTHNGTLVVVVGFVFGTWFLMKALDGFGVL
jgi:hypothetical protein